MDGSRHLTVVATERSTTISYMRVLALVRRAIPRTAPRKNFKLRLKVAAGAVMHCRQLARLASSPSPALQRVMDERPELLIGSLVWPYLCATWGTPERLDRIVAHYRELDRLGPPFLFGVEEKLILAELEEIYPDLRIVLDQPGWFMREGGLALNLFVGDFRAYSLAFALGRSEDGHLHCRIGAIQGRNTAAALDLYKELTKATHGLRPRDLLVEICRMLCRHWGVRQLLAVRDSSRHHRHPFFAGKEVAPQDYDAIWQDRGGVPQDADFYCLPVEADRRLDEEIKPNKRSLYRRRYRFLDELEANMIARLPKLKPVEFTDL